MITEKHTVPPECKCRPIGLGPKEGCDWDIQNSAWCEEWRKIFFITLSQISTMSHMLKLIGRRLRRDQMSDWFTWDIISLWNLLLAHMMMATNFDGFKRGLDTFMDEGSIKATINYGCALPPSSLTECLWI